MRMGRISIAALVAVAIALAVVSSSCIGSACTPESMKTSSETKAPSVDECINICHSYGFGWKAQITGQDPGNGLLHCNCYAC